MSSPLIFFMIVLIGDLILKTAREKKKIEESKERKTKDLGENFEYSEKEEKEVRKEPSSIRDMMERLREEAEKKQRKEMEKRQEKAYLEKETNLYSEKEERVKKEYEDNEYWERKEKEKTFNEKRKFDIQKEVEKKESDIRNDIIKGIIFSEIISEPKAIKNQKRNM